MKKFETLEKPMGVVVLVHGAQEHHRRYDWLISKWNEAGYHVITDDLVGQRMQRIDYGHIDSFSQYTKQVLSWISLAHGYNLPIFLFGHSLGGLILVRLLQEVEMSIAGVILSSPMLGLIERKSELAKSANTISGVFKSNVVRDFGVTADMVTRNKELLNNDDPLYLAGASVGWYKETTVAMEKAFEELSGFSNVPILIQQSGEDKVVDKRKVRLWFNNCRSSDKHYKEWDGLYHEVFNEPERDEVFKYTMKYVEICLLNVGYEV